MADEISELEVEHGGDPGHQQQEQRDHQQIARLEQQHEAIEGVAAEALVHAGALRVSCGGQEPALLRLQHAYHQGRDREPDRRNQQQRVGSHRLHEERVENRGGDRADGAAGGDEAEQPLGLGAREDVGHHAPEHGDDQHVESAQPDVEARCDPAVVLVGLEREVEPHHADRDDAVDPGQERGEADARGKPRIHGRHDEAQEKRPGEQLLQVIDAVDGPFRIAQRLQDEVAGHQEEEIDERDRDRLDLERLDVGDRFEHTREAGRILGLIHGRSWAGLSRP